MKKLTLFLVGLFILEAFAQAAGAVPKSKEDLLRERAYQQELAQTRAAEAKERATFEERLRGLSADEKFRLWIERASALLAKTEFQAAMRAFNQAMTSKPTAVLGDQERALQAALQAQSRIVEITLLSDGLTWVSIRNVRSPQTLTTAPVKIFPGNYEVIGRRAGYRDVVVPLVVRAGVSPSVVKVVCTERP